jgi:hypothetical protein
MQSHPQSMQSKSHQEKEDLRERHYMHSTYIHSQDRIPYIILEERGL